MSLIFLCHASEDKAIAETIQLALANAGYEVFYDEQSLPPGGDYQARISAAINSCDLFVFIASSASIAAGRFTLAELKFARKRWPSPIGHVLPVVIDGLKTRDLPNYLQATTVLTVSGNAAVEVRAEVVSMLREVRRKPSRPWVAALAIGSALILLLVILIYFVGKYVPGPFGERLTPYLLPNDAIGWWPGENNAKDLVGHNDGKMESGVSTVQGKVNLAFLFNGEEAGGGVNLDNPPDFRFTANSSFTLEAWVNISGLTKGTNDSQVIISLNYDCGNTMQMLSIDRGGKASFDIRDQALAEVEVVSPDVIEPNSWHHLAGVREVGENGKILMLYIDGKRVGKGNVDRSTGDLASTSRDVDFIGRRAKCGTNNTFYGIIDEPTIYGRALTGDEIKGIFDAGSAGKRAKR